MLNTILNVSMFPKQIQIEQKKAHVSQETVATSCELSRERGGHKMDSKPIRLEIDNRAFFDSLGLKSIESLAQDFIAEGKRAVSEGTARYCIEGRLLAERGSEAMADIAKMRTNTSIETVLAFIPEHPPEISWKDGYIEIEYTPDRLHFDWQIGKVNLEYQPYNIEFHYQA